MSLVRNTNLLFVLLLVPVLGMSQQQDALTVFWDCSLSHAKTETTVEMRFLDSLIQADRIEKVRWVSFSDSYEITDLDGPDLGRSLKDAIENAVYDGSTDFDNLDHVARMGRVVAVTDGNIVVPNDFLSLDKGDLLLVNSTKADTKTLQLWGFLNRVDLIDLDPDNRSQIAPKKGIKGAVYLDGKPLAQVLVEGAPGNEPVITDASGRFEYGGRVGDTLRISLNGEREMIQVIASRDTDVTFFLDSQTVALDEVVVKDRYLTKTTKVRTAYGLQNENAVGYSVGTVADSDINDSEAKLHEALDGKVSGMQITKASGWDNRSTLGRTLIRGTNSINMNNYALIVIDGIPVESTDKFGAFGANATLTAVNNASPSAQGQREALFDHVNPDNIAEVTVLKGLAATNRFGTLGANGVIMITTKTSLGGDASGKPIDRARLTDNIFEGKLVSKKGQLNTKYLKALKKAKSVKAAYQLYLEQRGAYKEQFHYYIDVADYFRTANTRLADKVLSNIIELDLGYDALRALYLNYVHLGANQKALLTARLLTEGHPKKIQAHFEVAMAHKKAGNYQQALQLLNGMVTGTLDPRTDFSPLHKVAATELRNLVNQRKGQLDLDQVDAAYRNNLTYNARLVIDWQGASDAFVLKFVNPQNRFFDWEHSALADKQAIVNERRHGYSVEQFEIVGDMAVGQWQVYVTNLSTSQETPNWVKCTVQYNYGKPNQRSEEHLVRLDKDSDKEQLFFTFTAN